MLVIGYGNPGRMDDGLGPAFAERIAAARLPGVEIQQDYQLTVEHALELTRTDCVIFADAMVGTTGPFAFAALEPARLGDISSHSLSPAALLALTEMLYGAAPRAYVMGIAGVEFGEVKEGLSRPAQRNLDNAVAFFIDWLRGASGSAGGDEEVLGRA